MDPLETDANTDVLFNGTVEVIESDEKHLQELDIVEINNNQYQSTDEVDVPINEVAVVKTDCDQPNKCNVSEDYLKNILHNSNEGVAMVKYYALHKHLKRRLLVCLIIDKLLTSDPDRRLVTQ